MNEEQALKEALLIFGKEYVNELTNQLRKLDKVATGDLIRSLDVRLIKTAFGTIYTIELLAENYLQFVDAGRRPGKFAPVRALQKWARVKGIPQRAVYPINLKIKEQGIKPTHVLDKTLKRMDQNRRALNQLEDDLEDWTDALIEQLMFDLSKNNNITVRVK